MVADGAAGVALLLARLLFGGALLFFASNHFTNAGMIAGYASSKGVPAPKFASIASGVTLALGALSILLGAYVTVGAGALVVFFALVTPAIHNFWAVPEDEQMDQMQHFLKNVTIFGGALAFLAISNMEWAFALGGSVL